MGSVPNWKVYNAQNEYVAACKFVEDAAAIIAAYGEGATLRFATNRAKKDALWVEGKEAFPAGESYDRVAEVVHDRLDRLRR